MRLFFTEADYKDNFQLRNVLREIDDLGLVVSKANRGGLVIWETGEIETSAIQELYTLGVTFGNLPIWLEVDIEKLSESVPKELPNAYNLDEDGNRLELKTLYEWLNGNVLESKTEDRALFRALGYLDENGNITTIDFEQQKILIEAYGIENVLNWSDGLARRKQDVPSWSTT